MGDARASLRSIAAAAAQAEHAPPVVSGPEREPFFRAPGKKDDLDFDISPADSTRDRIENHLRDTTCQQTARLVGTWEMGL